MAIGFTKNASNIDTENRITGNTKNKEETKKEKIQRVLSTKLYVDIRNDQWPIVYHPLYNVSFYGIERLHPFDSLKWGRVYSKLIESGMLNENQFVLAPEASDSDLQVVHPARYLASLKCSCRVASYVEIFLVAFLPSCIIDRYLLRPFRYHTGGSILAAHLALKRKWAINLGGGFHHASQTRGGGFCVYADITLAITFLFLRRLISSAMIIDLDAHQGNGHERDFFGDNRVYIFDMYNHLIYPNDKSARRAISRSVQLRDGVQDNEYMNLLSTNLDAALNEFQPDIIVYNAGTDCLAGDPLGLLSLSKKGVINRDEMVFSFARRFHTPIVMLTSGGYMPNNYEVITQSILNLHEKGLISEEN